MKIKRGEEGGCRLRRGFIIVLFWGVKDQLVGGIVKKTFLAIDKKVVLGRKF